MNLCAEVAGALAYGAGRYADGQAGKTLLVGWRDGEALFALGAGLWDDEDRQRFATLARYLLRRDEADGYWLLLSADIQGAEHLVAEVVRCGDRQLAAAAVRRAPDDAFGATGDVVELGHAAPLGDLLDGGGTLAAIMRRELDRLAEALGQPLPVVG